MARQVAFVVAHGGAIDRSLLLSSLSGSILVAGRRMRNRRLRCNVHYSQPVGVAEATRARRKYGGGAAGHDDDTRIGTRFGVLLRYWGCVSWIGRGEKNLGGGCDALEKKTSRGGLWWSGKGGTIVGWWSDVRMKY
ncbi:hypothetical protein LR48_Vigan11g135300 [Vigna angularis]|uniref:Uncharacterized protein n=1 Tax=Phaseolus angularis TaxID=3914 RepID=A0A0L9VU69_PHAAN|nr:hypothetical protein LR48_Vigan11g135300 [Vigna angularis]